MNRQHSRVTKRTFQSTARSFAARLLSAALLLGTAAQRDCSAWLLDTTAQHTATRRDCSAWLSRRSASTAARLRHGWRSSLFPFCHFAAGLAVLLLCVTLRGGWLCNELLCDELLHWWTLSCLLLRRRTALACGAALAAAAARSAVLASVCGADIFHFQRRSKFPCEHGSADRRPLNSY